MDKLGIEPVLLLAQIVNFFIMMVLLKKYLFRPILSMIEKRKKEIADGLALSSKMHEEEEKLKAKEEKALAKAREEALSIIESAKKQAKEVEKELVTKAHTQAANIIARAKEEVVELEAQSKISIRSQAVDLAVVMAKRLLTTIMSAKTQHALIASHMKDLEKWSKDQSETV